MVSIWDWAPVLKLFNIQRYRIQYKNGIENNIGFSEKKKQIWLLSHIAGCWTQLSKMAGLSTIYFAARGLSLGSQIYWGLQYVFVKNFTSGNMHLVKFQYIYFSKWSQFRLPWRHISICICLNIKMNFSKWQCVFVEN